MKYRIYKNTLFKMTQKLNLMTLLVVLLGFSNIITGSLSWYTSLHQKTYITPFYSNNGFEISGTSVDRRYLNLMAENFVYAKLNVTPKNVDHQHQLLLKYVSSKEYGRFKELLAREAKIIKDKEISSQINITSIRTDEAKRSVLVHGELLRMVDSRVLPSEEVNYFIRFDYLLGQLSIKEFKKTRGVRDA